MSRLKDKAIVLTGGGGAIGRQIALTLLQQGAILGFCDSSQDAGKETLALLEKNGFKAKFTVVDVSNENQVKKWIDDSAQEFGKIDALVNNAAVFVFGKVEDVTNESWDKVFAVNVKGYAFCAKYVVPHMKKQKSGSIINMASISSFIAQPAFVPYNSTKGAVMQMTRCMAMDLGADGVRVNAVCPGTIDTPATRNAHPELTEEQLKARAYEKQFLLRLGSTQDVAWAVVFLASDESTFVTGTSLMVDGGRTAM